MRVMKRCRYCNAESKRTDKHCSSCGSVSFDIICDNCNSVHSSNFCPNCGLATIEVKVKCEKAEKTKKKELIWTVGLLTLFPPVGILLTWVLMKEWNKVTKIVITSFAAAWFAVSIYLIHVITTAIKQFIDSVDWDMMFNIFIPLIVLGVMFAPVIAIIFRPKQQSNSEPIYPKQNIGIHIILFYFTAGIGNVIYFLHVKNKQKQWKNNE
ncbi:MAG: zinc ribbon domain-containing protein [Oscillospiraceae bacterium]|nr:zinc ribbon domain-containing protein [Oscillospiraceae bacterium]